VPRAVLCSIPAVRSLVLRRQFALPKTPPPLADFGRGKHVKSVPEVCLERGADMG